MLSVLIVEDESKIRHLIATLVDWDSINMKLIGTCDNGISALRIIESERPDIVITDIRMPGMDGIELIRRVREMEFPCEFIIISGYREFEYAHSAVCFDVVEYLLKPIEKDDLIKAIEQIVKRRNSYYSKIRVEDECIQKTRRQLRDAFVSRLIDSPSSLEITLDSLNNQYQFNFHNDALFRSVVIAFAKARSDIPEKLYADLIENVLLILAPLCWDLVPYTDNNRNVIFIMNYDPTSKIMEHMTDIYKSVSDCLSHVRDGTPMFSIGVGSAQPGIANIRSTLISAERAAFCGVIRGYGKMYIYDTLLFDDLTIDDILPREHIAQLRTYAETLDSQAFVSLVRQALFRTGINTNPVVLLDACGVIADTLVNAIRSIGYLSVEDNYLALMHSELFKRATRTDLINYMISWAEEQIDKCLQERQELGSRPVRAAKKYIEEHYMELVTLEKLADIVHLNTSYFSIIFKKETGYSFTDYLVLCRMEQAKRLLRESDLSISEICEAVGYSDVKHFRRLFIKFVGAKPSAYRMLHG